jgi:hypothetical protein
MKTLLFIFCIATLLVTGCGVVDTAGTETYAVAAEIGGEYEKYCIHKKDCLSNKSSSGTDLEEPSYEDFCADETRRQNVELWETLIYSLYLAPYDGLEVTHNSLTATTSNPTVGLQCESAKDDQVAACEKKAAEDYRRCIRAGHLLPGPWTDWAACLSDRQSDLANCKSLSNEYKSALTLSLDLEVGNQTGSATITSKLELSSAGGYCISDIQTSISGFGPILTAVALKMVNEKFPSGERTCMGSTGN